MNASGVSSNLLWSARPKHPYPGLRPFDADEWMIFFGREKMIEDVIERLARNRLVFIHGASGSGKSSLVRAGLLPRLEAQHKSHGEEWHTCTMRPSGGPLRNLAEQFAKFEGRSDESARVDEIAALLDRRDATLASVAGEIEGLAGKRLCILVDQFEELFRFEREISREEAELFIDLLIGGIDTTNELDEDEFGPPPPPAPVNERHANVHIVVTMRSEFFGECARFDGLAEAINRTQYLVPRMSHEALLKAIRRPAQIYGGEVAVDLAERLIAEARGREDELPLIQHGLMELWKKASENSKERNEKITLDVGLLDGGMTLSSLLSSHADEVMEKAATTPVRGRAVENLFRALIEQTAKKQAIRRPQQFKELAAVSNVSAEELGTIIDAFRADGVTFLMPAVGAIKRDTMIDISHEALIRCWNKIADQRDGWLKRETDDGIRWSLLLAQAKEFETNPKQLLFPAYAEGVKSWLAERAKVKRLSKRYGGELELVNKLLKASLRYGKNMRLVNAFAWVSLMFLITLTILILSDFYFGDPSSKDKGIYTAGALIAYGFVAVIWCIFALVVLIRKLYNFSHNLVYKT
jgi:energy-coupling factor transporter ATP-binding protein EcfA2